MPPPFLVNMITYTECQGMKPIRAEAPLLRSVLFFFLTLSLSHSLAPHSQATASCANALAMLGIMFILVLLLVSSIKLLSSSNPLLYKKISSKKKTPKIGAWRVIVIVLVSCYLIALGSADTVNKVCLEAVM